MMPFLEEPPRHAKRYVHWEERVALVLTSVGAGVIVLTTLFMLALYGLGILH